MSNLKRIAALLNLFPAEWKSEYGVELSSLLERSPLTPAVTWDVIRSAASAQFRRCPFWLKASACVACWYFVGLVANTTRPMSPMTYDWYWRSYGFIAIGFGYRYRNTGEAPPGRRTGHVILLGLLPMFVLWLARILHLLDPTMLDLQGHVRHLGHWYTEFGDRGDQSKGEILSVPVIALLGWVSYSISGWIGARLADIVHAFQAARIKAR